MPTYSNYVYLDYFTTLIDNLSVCSRSYVIRTLYKGIHASLHCTHATAFDEIRQCFQYRIVQYNLYAQCWSVGIRQQTDCKISTWCKSYNHPGDQINATSRATHGLEGYNNLDHH